MALIIDLDYTIQVKIIVLGQENKMLCKARGNTDSPQETERLRKTSLWSTKATLDESIDTPHPFNLNSVTQPLGKYLSKRFGVVS